MAPNFKGQSNLQGDDLGDDQGQFPRANPWYYDLQVFSYEVSKQIFFGLDLEVGPFSSRGKIRVRLRRLKANQTFKETTLESTKGSFQEPTQGTMTSRPSVTKCLCKSSLDLTLKLVYFGRQANQTTLQPAASEAPLAITA